MRPDPAIVAVAISITAICVAAIWGLTAARLSDNHTRAQIETARILVGKTTRASVKFGSKLLQSFRLITPPLPSPYGTGRKTTRPMRTKRSRSRKATRRR
jgi:hypothetical protein